MSVDTARMSACTTTSLEHRLKCVPPMSVCAIGVAGTETEVCATQPTRATIHAANMEVCTGRYG
jgi:hypothetical protein